MSAANDFIELIRLLESHPESRAKLLTILLSPETSELPDLLPDLVAAEARTEENTRSLGTQVAALNAAQNRAEERLEHLAMGEQRTEERIEQLALAQQRSDEQIEQLLSAVAGVRHEVVTVKEEVTRLRRDLSLLMSSAIEHRYRELAPAYFGGLLHRARLVPPQELADLVEDAEDARTLSDEERNALLTIALVVHGQRRVDLTEAFVAVEVSETVERDHIDQAVARAVLLARVSGKPVMPAVAGEAISPAATQAAHDRHVWCVVSGKVLAPEDDA